MSETAPPRCSVVIATLDRIESLRVVLRDLGAQTTVPCELIIAAAGATGPVSELVRDAALPFAARVIACAEKSSALQRNRAAAEAAGEVIAFLDDDIEFGPDLLARTLVHFADPAVGGVAPRIAHSDRPAPGRLTRLYYRMQAGYGDADYGARLFGVGLNCLPVFTKDSPARIRADWLPSTCLFLRTELFRRHQFPAFTGYSFAEDVHLTARVARESELYFLREPTLLHHSLTSEFKRDVAALTAGKLHNMAIIARDVQGLRGFALWWRWQLHRVFLTAVHTLRRPAGWREELRGVWRARP
ncbi:MAG: hypothetical protein C0518_09275 [Opitutus sp.]|nr:hypothetical protein [Opitutus sp.]